MNVMQQIREISPGFSMAAIMIKSTFFGVIAGILFTLALSAFVMLLTLAY